MSLEISRKYLSGNRQYWFPWIRKIILWVPPWEKCGKPVLNVNLQALSH